MTTDPASARPRFKWWQKFLMGLGATVLIIAVLLSILVGVLYWSIEVAKTKLDESTSPDGSHKVIAYQIGSPILFGSSKVRVILFAGDDEINRLDTYIANDGASLHPTNAVLGWDKDAAVVSFPAASSPRNSANCSSLVEPTASHLKSNPRNQQ